MHFKKGMMVCEDCFVNTVWPRLCSGPPPILPKQHWSLQHHGSSVQWVSPTTWSHRERFCQLAQISSWRRWAILLPSDRYLDPALAKTVTVLLHSRFLFKYISLKVIEWWKLDVKSELNSSLAHSLAETNATSAIPEKYARSIAMLLTIWKAASGNSITAFSVYFTFTGNIQFNTSHTRKQRWNSAWKTAISSITCGPTITK